LDSKFVDSDIFIYVLMNDPDFAARSVQILIGFEEGKEIGWTSTLALSQVYSHLKHRREYQAIDKFYDYLDESPISVKETTLEDFEHAKKMKDEFNLTWKMWDDLVIASQMERLKIAEIYSNDSDFDKFKNLRRLF
jgi:predicted nucleic acid-binding protein